MSIPMSWRSSASSHSSEYEQYVGEDSANKGGYVIHNEPEHHDNSHDDGGH